MEWWSVFRKVRKAIFIFILITSLIWAGVLTFYLIREWDHFSVLQRTIVISMISVNAITIIVQYLMIVLIFRVWRDFARMMFLLSIHTASSVLYTLFGPNFSCVIFHSKSLCEDIDIAFLACSWAITGLLVGYTAYLCIMSRVPRPIPQITPNLLINSDNTRRPSISSVNSATHLLTGTRDREISSPKFTTSPQIESPQTRMVPKKLFVVNGLPSPEASPTATTATPRGAFRMHPGGSYGAMGVPRGMAASPAPTYQSQSTVTTTATTPMTPAATWNSGSAVRFGQKRFSRPEALPLPNPFLDPVSRPGTADTSYTYSSNTSSFGPRGDADFGRDMIYLSPFNIPPMNFDEEKASLAPKSPSSESIFSLYGSDSPREVTDVDLEKATAATMAHAHYLSPHNATVRFTLSSPPRTHTATPHSVHSVAPSVDFTAAEQQYQYVRHQGHQQEMNRMPPPVHARAASDPVYRPYTASPRLVHPQQPTTYAAPYGDITVPLPNPFPMVGAANVHRYASSGHMRAQSYQTNYTANVRNVHLQAAMGRAPPRTQPYPVVNGNGIERATSKKVVSRAEWKQLVMNAASGR